MIIKYVPATAKKHIQALQINRLPRDGNFLLITHT